MNYKHRAIILWQRWMSGRINGVDTAKHSQANQTAHAYDRTK